MDTFVVSATDQIARPARSLSPDGTDGIFNTGFSEIVKSDTSLRMFWFVKPFMDRDQVAFIRRLIGMETVATATKAIFDGQRRSKILMIAIGTAAYHEELIIPCTEATSRNRRSEKSAHLLTANERLRAGMALDNQ